MRNETDMEVPGQDNSSASSPSRAEAAVEDADDQVIVHKDASPSVPEAAIDKKQSPQRDERPSVPVVAERSEDRPHENRDDVSGELRETTQAAPESATNGLHADGPTSPVPRREAESERFSPIDADSHANGIEPKTPITHDLDETVESREPNRSFCLPEARDDRDSRDRRDRVERREGPREDERREHRRRDSRERRHSDERRDSRERRRRRRRRHHDGSDDLEEEREYRRRRRRRRRRSHSRSRSPMRSPSEERERDRRRLERRQRRRERELLWEEERERRRKRREEGEVNGGAGEVLSDRDGASQRRDSPRRHEHSRRRSHRGRHRSRGRDEEPVSGEGELADENPDEWRSRRRRRREADEELNDRGELADEDPDEYRRRRRRRREREEDERRFRNERDYRDNYPDRHYRRRRSRSESPRYDRGASGEHGRSAPYRRDSYQPSLEERAARDFPRDHRRRDWDRERHGRGRNSGQQASNGWRNDPIGQNMGRGTYPNEEERLLQDVSGLARFEGRLGPSLAKAGDAASREPQPTGESLVESGDRTSALFKKEANPVELKAKLIALKRDHLRAKVLASIGKKTPQREGEVEKDQLDGPHTNDDNAD